MDTLTVIHTGLSLIALVLGIPAALTLLGRPLANIWTTLFLAFSVATTGSGFFLPFDTLTPAVATGIVSSVVLIAVYAAFYGFRCAGFWSKIYAGGIILSIYLLVFVTIAQTFMKIPFFHALAPTMSEIPFAASQLVALIAFIWLGIKTLKKFKPPLTISTIT